MPSAFPGTHLQATAEDEVAPTEIEREIVKLKEDSARDVQRQLEQQRVAATVGKVEEGVKNVAEDMRGGLAPLWKGAEQEVETAIKHTEAEVKRVENQEKADRSRKAK